MAQIFVSYAREDEARIRPLVHALEAEDWTVFWDRRIPAGQTWRSYIGDALSKAGCVIVVWSRQSVASSWVSEEADEGKHRGVLVPMLLDDVAPPIGFRSIQAADLSDGRMDRGAPNFVQLVEDIRAVLGQSQASPAAQLPRPETERRASLSSTSNRSTGLPIFGVVAILLAALAGGIFWMMSRAPQDRVTKIIELERRNSSATATSRPVVGWGVIFGSDRTIDGARDEIRRAERSGIPSAALFLRNGYYASIAVTDDRDTAESYLAIARGFRGDAYIASMEKWCIDPAPRDGFTECRTTR